MEIRNIQRTGGSSFSVTLPKQWVEKLGLKDKDPVELTIQSSGALVIQPQKHKPGTSAVISKSGDLSESELTREIISAYLSGAEEITIKDHSLNQQRRKQVRQITQALMGLEIINESADQIVLRNIFDSSRLSIPQNIGQMFLITRTMFADAVKALYENDAQLATDVADRDLEIDKFHFAIIRQFQSLITGKVSEQDCGISLVDCNYYAFVATQIERIADHAVKIASTVGMADSQPANLQMAKFESQTKIVVEMLNRCERMVQTLNKQAAHDMLDKFQISEKIASPRKPKQAAQVEPIVSDSLERVQRYIFNIAEMTIDQSVIITALA